MPTFLRIKRKRADIPVESFSAEGCAKRPRPSVSSEVSLFRYVGSHSVDENDADIALTDLAKCSTNGSSRILWSVNRGTVIAENKPISTDYKVNIQTLKRRASVGENAFPDPGNEPIEGPNLPKILKIIDLIPTTRLDDPLAAAVEVLQISEHSKQDDYNLQQGTLDYVFDIYRLECRKRQSSTSSPDENASGLIQSPELVLYDDEDDEKSGFEPGLLHLEEEDDDSNSESNWRNDYPEEEEDGSSSSSRSSISSSQSSSPTDHRMIGR